MVARLFLAILCGAVSIHAQSYAVDLTGGIVGSVSFTGMGSYTGDYRVDTQLIDCVNPNTGAVHNVISGVISLQWSGTSNVLQARDWNSTTTSTNILTMNTAAWPSKVDIRYQRDAGAGGRTSMEKWDSSGGGYQVTSVNLTGTTAIGFVSLALGAATTGCKVGFVRVYLDNIPLGSAPPSAVSNPTTGALRVWGFDDQASPAADTSGNGGNMTFSATPTWVAEDTGLACWATAAGNSTAGSPINLAAYARGSVASRLWKVTSQPPIGTARLSDYASASPSLLNATAGSYGFSANVIASGGSSATCSTAQTIAAPAAGTGGYLKYSFGLNFAAYPGTDSARISVIQPTGIHVAGSPYRCWATPCQVWLEDTGMGMHTYRIERLNSSGAVIAGTDWKPLKTTAVAAIAVPAPPRTGTLPLIGVPYWHSSDRADEFLATRLDYRIAGGEGQPSPNSNPLTYNPNMIWAYYLDLASYNYNAEYWSVRDHSVANSWPYEDYVMHSDKDHGNSQAWTFVNRFGDDERFGTAAAKKGVMIWNGTAFLAGPDDPDVSGTVATPDHSMAAFNAATGDVPIGNGHTMYIGSPEPFDLVNVVVGTAQSGGSVTWEYYNGSGWVTLSVAGASAAFAASGQATFTPPSGWAVTAVNSSRSKFWIRATVSGSSTAPILSRVYGDEWYTYSSPVTISAISSHSSDPTFTTPGAHGLIVGDMVKFGGTTGGWVAPLTAAASPGGGYWLVRTVPSSTTFTVRTINTSVLGAYPGSFTVHKRSERGWNSTSGTIVSVAGGYSYNPTPPATATARFRYQARMRSFYTSGTDWFLTNHHLGSPVRYWGRYMAEKIVARLTPDADFEGFKGFMADNADAIPENISKDTFEHMEWPQYGVPWVDTHYTDIRDSMAEMFTELRDYVHAEVPGAKIGGNAPFRSGNICFVLDFCLFENRMTAFIPYAYSETVNSVGADAAGYDTLADPDLNPLGSIGFMHCFSPDTLDPVDSSGNQYWYDKADRRPIGCLATHYIGWNGDATMGFGWNAGTTTYNTDDNYWFMCCDTVLTTSITADTSGATKTFNVADTSMYWNPGSLELALVIGDPPNADFIGVNSWTGNTITTTSAIVNSWPSDTLVRARKIGHQATTILPRERLLFQSQWFEAMATDIGVPDSMGHNGGLRDLVWKTPAEYGGATGSLNMHRRDYTLGIVIVRPTNTAVETNRAARMNGCSDKMALGGTYYRLHADGNTEATPYTEIGLREGEAFIGLKTATAKVTEVPAWQQNTCP